MLYSKHHATKRGIRSRLFGGHARRVAEVNQHDHGVGEGEVLQTLVSNNLAYSQINAPEPLRLQLGRVGRMESNLCARCGAVGYQ